MKSSLGSGSITKMKWQGRGKLPLLRALCFAVLFCAGVLLFAQTPGLLKGLSSAEVDLLAQGKAVIRTVSDYRALALVAPGEAADRVRSAVASVRPNYLTEVLAIIPAADEAAAEGLIKRLATALADPKGYIGIPYWSKRQQKTYDLFDKMVIDSRTPSGNGERIETLQHMEPFDDFRARYEYSLLVSGSGSGRSTALLFSSVNLDPIIYSYQKFKAVSTGDMVWCLYAFRDGSRVVFYGVGAVKVFDLFGAFRDRLEASFMGRVEAFFGFMSARMRG
jgi:hypothetical protein